MPPKQNTRLWIAVGAAMAVILGLGVAMTALQPAGPQPAPRSVSPSAGS